MMTTPMENGDFDLSYRERAQRLYNKNVDLEKRSRKAAQARDSSDPNAWQQMRDNYEVIILEDHTFSEQHGIEYALWQLHYKRIEELRALFSSALASARSATSQNGKRLARPGPDRVTKIRSHFKTFLSEATGFYHDFILKVKAKYGIPFGHFSDDADNQIGLFKDGNNSSEMKKGLISCHRCFIYLGDLARYKGLYGEGDSKARHFAAASSYYMQASSLWPSSGNPHHQLAILAAYSGDELVVIYRYFRSLAVNIPFATARDNLIIAFEKNRQSYSQLHGNPKGSTLEVPSVIKGREEIETKEQQCIVPNIFKVFSSRFVRLNGILFMHTSLETFGDVLLLVKSDLLKLLSSGPEEECNFGSDSAECRIVIVRLVAMLIFTIDNLNKETESKSYAEILQRSVMLQNAFAAIFEFMGHIVQRCVQLADYSTSYLLSGIMVFLEWLAFHEDIAAGGQVEDKQANARSFFWSHCISFFNKLLSSGFTFIDEDGDETCFFNMTRYNEGEAANRVALSEDIELRGFLPLLPAQLILDFSRKHFGTDSDSKETKARIQRIIAAGKSLANVVRVGEQGIHFDIKLKRFVIGVEPQISVDNSQISPWGDPRLDDSGQDHLIDRETFAKSLQPKTQFYVEGDEEDEVIVFKPTATEKLIDGIDARWNTSEVPVSGVNALTNGFGEDASFSASHNGSLPWNAFDMGSRPSTSVGSISATYLQPIQPTSNWLVEQGSVANGLANLNLLEHEYAFKPELPDHPGIFHSTAISAPHLHSNIVGAGNKYPVRVQDPAKSPKYDSVMSSRVGSDDLAKKSLPLTSTALKKNPVSRPVRHLGPPPGFSTIPPKIVENSSPAANLSNGNLVMDDYRWLDGYQMPPLTQSMQFDKFMVQAGAYHPMSSINSSLGMVTFPFPGKQASVLQVQLENQKGLQDYQVPEHLKVHQDKQQHLHRGNQQALPQQYHGQSIWEGRFST